jgi:radical SAM superfamily enzyme YgiQ (UPF0313 family)
MTNDNTPYDFPPYRPPSEADSALIRLSRGCPWNRCLFCTMYKETRFEARPTAELLQEIDRGAEIFAGARTVFLADSDSLVMKDAETLVARVRERFPFAERVTTYARARTLKMLGPEKLGRLKSAGLTRVHVGLESGDPQTLKFLAKGTTAEQMVAGGRAAKEAGLELCYYVLIGAGGKERLTEHAVESARVCNQARPDFIRLRTLVAQKGSALAEERSAGRYHPTSPLEKLEEVKRFISELDLEGCELASDHFTNNIWLESRVVYGGVYGTLPDQQEEMLAVLRQTLEFLETVEGRVRDITMLYDRGLIESL